MRSFRRSKALISGSFMWMKTSSRRASDCCLERITSSSLRSLSCCELSLTMPDVGMVVQNDWQGGTLGYNATKKKPGCQFGPLVLQRNSSVQDCANENTPWLVSYILTQTGSCTAAQLSLTSRWSRSRTDEYR